MIEINIARDNYYPDQYHQAGVVSNNIASIQNSNALMNEMNNNGQVLFETYPSISYSGGFEIITNTGQLYLTGFELFENNDNIRLSPDQLNYNQLTGGFNENLNVDFDEDTVYYLNGQKLMFDVDYNGSLLLDISGVLFSRTNEFENMNTGKFDILEPYRDNGFSAYLNGLSLHVDDFLQTNSLVINKINTGLQPNIYFLCETDKEDVIYL